jgi:hypothetical protein
VIEASFAAQVSKPNVSGTDINGQPLARHNFKNDRGLPPEPFHHHPPPHHQAALPGIARTQSSGQRDCSVPFGTHPLASGQLAGLAEEDNSLLTGPTCKMQFSNEV